MIEVNQGAIVLVDFNYSNHVHSKLRPALVISNSSHNKLSRDVVVMKVTSKKPQRWGFPVTNNDLVNGSLAYDSFVQIDAIHSLEKSIIISVIGMLKPDTMNDIHKQIFDLLTPDSPAYGSGE